MQARLFDLGIANHETTERDGRSRLAKTGEYLVAFEFVIRGFDVSLAAEGLPYDLLADFGGRIVRVQVKTASAPSDDGRYSFSTSPCSHKSAKRSRRYAAADVDLFALVAADIRRVVFLTAEEVVRLTNVRLRPTDFLAGDAASITFERCKEAILAA